MSATAAPAVEVPQAVRDRVEAELTTRLIKALASQDGFREAIRLRDQSREARMAHEAAIARSHAAQVRLAILERTYPAPENLTALLLEAGDAARVAAREESTRHVEVHRATTALGNAREQLLKGAGAIGKSVLWGYVGELEAARFDGNEEVQASIRWLRAMHWIEGRAHTILNGLIEGPKVGK